MGASTPQYHPDGIKENSSDRIWSSWLIMAMMLLAFWTDRFFQRQRKSMILEQIWTMLCRLSWASRERTSTRLSVKKVQTVSTFPNWWSSLINQILSLKVFVRVKSLYILTMNNPNSRDAAALHKINHRLFVFIDAQDREILSLADRRAAESGSVLQSERCKCDSCIWHVLSLEFVKVVRGRGALERRRRWGCVPAFELPARLRWELQLQCF